MPSQKHYCICHPLISYPLLCVCPMIKAFTCYLDCFAPASSLRVRSFKAIISYQAGYLLRLLVSPFLCGRSVPKGSNFLSECVWILNKPGSSSSLRPSACFANFCDRQRRMGGSRLFWLLCCLGDGGKGGRSGLERLRRWKWRGGGASSAGWECTCWGKQLCRYALSVLNCWLKRFPQRRSSSCIDNIMPIQNTHQPANNHQGNTQTPLSTLPHSNCLILQILPTTFEQFPTQIVLKMEHEQINSYPWPQTPSVSVPSALPSISCYPHSHRPSSANFS